MYSEILKCNYEIQGDVAVFDDGVKYTKTEMDHLNKVTCDVELMRLAHAAKIVFNGEVVFSQ